MVCGGAFGQTSQQQLVVLCSCVDACWVGVGVLALVPAVAVSVGLCFSCSKVCVFSDIIQKGTAHNTQYTVSAWDLLQRYPSAVRCNAFAHLIGVAQIELTLCVCCVTQYEPLVETNPATNLEIPQLSSPLEPAEGLDRVGRHTKSMQTAQPKAVSCNMVN